MDVLRAATRSKREFRSLTVVFGTLWIGLAGGCYAPLRSPGIRASDLPDSFRTPSRVHTPRINLATLTVPPTADYFLGAGDVLEVAVFSGALPDSEYRPLRVEIMGNGEIQLPMVGAVRVGGFNLAEAQKAITAAYGDGIIRDPIVNVTIVQKSTVPIVVLGEVKTPGVVHLPKNESDIGHAVAAAGGFSENAEDLIEIHRRVHPSSANKLVPPAPAPITPTSLQVGDQHAAPLAPVAEGAEDAAAESQLADVNSSNEPKTVLRIPLIGPPPTLVTDNDVIQLDSIGPNDVTLQPGDVVRIPQKKPDVYYVVGELNKETILSFRARGDERELGSAYVLPKDRDIDVLTAVVIAGYLDPIESPTTATVQRNREVGPPLLMRVDLMRARQDPRENILIEPGDVIYLNPDSLWWGRRFFDRIVPSVATRLLFR